MAPNLESHYNIENLKHLDPLLILTPISIDSASVSDVDLWTSDTDENEDTNINNLIPLEYNLRDILSRATATEDLSTVTQVRLRVITSEICLQHLSIYMPALRELILDGSIVSTLRDLGCGMKNLKILKVNRCSLSCLDSMFGIENLEEFYAADNSISEVTPCAFLTNLRILDVQRNKIKTLATISLLSLCTELEHLSLRGNNEIDQVPNLRQKIRSLLSGLKTLDGETLLEDRNGNENVSLSVREEQHEEMVEKNKSSFKHDGRPGASQMKSFSIQFPPKVLNN